MKLDNIKSYVTNLQFSGGQPIGSGSAGVATQAGKTVALANFASSTGSFVIKNPYNVSYNVVLTSDASLTGSVSSSVTADNVTQNFIYVNYTGSSATQVVGLVRDAINQNIAGLYVSASAATTNLTVSASFGGVDGNNIIVSGSNLTGGTGVTNWPYNLGFVAGGLYVGVPGQLTVTTVDGSVLTLVSASGFIPGLVSSVSSSSTALGVIAFK